MPNGNMIPVTHVNVRLSISLLLLKLLFVEVVAAASVIFFYSVLLPYEGMLFQNVGMGFFNLPFYVALVIVKTFITFFIILQWLNEYYEITSTVLYHRRGLLFKVEEQYPLENMQRLEIFQSFFGKLFNYGTISLYDPRRKWYEDMSYIHNPMRYAKILEDLIPSADVRKSVLREHILEKDKFDTKFSKNNIPQEKIDVRNNGMKVLFENLHKKNRKAYL